MILSAGHTFYFAFEPELMRWLQSVIGSAGEAIFKMISLLGEQYLTVAILSILYLAFDKKAAVRIGLNVLMALMWMPMLKNIFLRRRPYFDHQSIKCLSPVSKEADIYDMAAQGYSLPSGHSATSLALLGSVASVWRRKVYIVLAIVIPFLIGLSRVALGVHYPTDVLAGWALGAFSIFFVSFLQEKITKKWLLYLILFGTSLAGCFYCKSEDYYTTIGVLAGFFAGDLFENRYVDFKETRNPWLMILRILGGAVIFFVLGVLLKLPFSPEFLESATPLAFLVRALRYAISLFAVMGLYPMVFRFEEKIGRRGKDTVDT